MTRVNKLFSPRAAPVRLVLLGLLITACSKDAPQNYLHPTGPIAKEQNNLWLLTFGIATVIFFLVEGVLLFTVMKFRQKSARDAPKQTHGNTKLEIAWTMAPALLLALVSIPTIKGVFELAETPRGNPLRVTVTAKQWWWEYEYQDAGVITANELHIPTGRPVYLALESDDVIHSFWVPKLAGKQDVVPGRTNYLTIRSDEPGTFYGQCVEFCGISHGNMHLRVIAQDPEDFDQWLGDQAREARPPAGGLAARGEQLFMEGACAGCHAINGTEAQGRVGPDLTHFSSRKTFAGSIWENNDSNLEKWLKDPPARKPGSKMPDLGLSDEEVEALIAYLRTLE